MLVLGKSSCEDEKARTGSQIKLPEFSREGPSNRAVKQREKQRAINRVPNPRRAQRALYMAVAQNTGYQNGHLG